MEKKGREDRENWREGRGTKGGKENGRKKWEGAMRMGKSRQGKDRKRGRMGRDEWEMRE